MTLWSVAGRLLCPWDFSGKNTEVGCLCLLQGIFPTQRLNPGLLPCRQILYYLSHRGSPDICIHIADLGLPGGASGKEPACQCRRRKRRRFHPWVGEIPWRRAWRPTLVFLPGESHEKRGLAGYSPWGSKEPDLAY